MPWPATPPAAAAYARAAAIADMGRMLFFDPALSASGLMACATCHDPAHGICASCHPGTASPDGKPPLFTDFGYAALGAPRNRAIPSNNDPSFFDLGLCGPYRTGLAGATP